MHRHSLIRSIAKLLRMDHGAAVMKALTLDAEKLSDFFILHRLSSVYRSPVACTYSTYDCSKIKGNMAAVETLWKTLADCSSGTSPSSVLGTSLLSCQACLSGGSVRTQALRRSLSLDSGGTRQNLLMAPWRPCLPRLSFLGSSWSAAILARCYLKCPMSHWTKFARSLCRRTHGGQIVH
jgi:hypothetical protein